MRWLAFAWYALRTTWSYEQGRWFVFRNTPDWFVDDVAGINTDDTGKDDDIKDYITQAQQERELRRRRRESTI